MPAGMNPTAMRDTVGAVVPRRLLTRPDHLSDTPDPRRISVGLISTYPPTRCGIGRFAHSLRSGLESVAPNAFVGVARLISSGDAFVPDPNVEVVFDPTSSSGVRAAARKVSRHDVALLQHEYGLFGPDDGEAVMELVGHLGIPLILGTIRNPGRAHRDGPAATDDGLRGGSVRRQCHPPRSGAICRSTEPGPATTTHHVGSVGSRQGHRAVASRPFPS